VGVLPTNGRYRRVLYKGNVCESTRAESQNIAYKWASPRVNLTSRCGLSCSHGTDYGYIHLLINIEALCTAPPEALSRSTSQTPLSCPVAPPSQHPAPRPSRAAWDAAWGAARVCWACVPPLEDVGERRGTKGTVTRPSRHPIRPPPRPAPSPTPRPSRARPSRVAKARGRCLENRPWASAPTAGFGRSKRL